MLGPAPGYRGRGRRGGPRGNYRPRGGGRGYRRHNYNSRGGGNPYIGGSQSSYRPRGRGSYHRNEGSYRRGGYGSNNYYNSNSTYRKRNYDDRSTQESRPHKRKYEPRTSKAFRSAEPQNVSFKLKRLVLGSGDPSSHENDEMQTRQHNGLFSSFHDMFLLTRVDSHQKTIQINAKRVEGSVFSTTIHPSSVYSINVFTESLPDESFFEKFEEQLVLEAQLDELAKELEEKEKSLEELKEKSEKGKDDDEEGEQEQSAVAEKKLELEIKQKELDVLEVNEKIKKAKDRLDTLQAEIFEESQNDDVDNEENIMEEEIKDDEEPEKMDEDQEEAQEEEDDIIEETAETVIDEDAINAMKVAELREYIRKQGQTPKGSKKAALLEMALAIFKESKTDETEQVEVDVTAGDDEEAAPEEAEGEDVAEEPAPEKEDEEEVAEEMVEEVEDAETETIDLTGETDDGKSLCRVFIGLKEPLSKVRTSLAGAKEASPKTYCLLLEADLKEGARFNKVKRFLESFVKSSYDSDQVNVASWGKKKVSKVASQLLKEAMKRRKHDFEMRECSNGCGKTLRAYELENHEKNDCPNRLITCQFCKLELMHCKMAEHKTVCDLAILRCPNNCGKSIARRDMVCHIADSCANQKVDCEFASLGCKMKEKRKNQTRHMNDRVVQHLTLVRKAHMKLQTKYDKLVEFLKSKFDDVPEFEEPEEDPEIVIIED